MTKTTGYFKVAHDTVIFQKPGGRGAPDGLKQLIHPRRWAPEEMGNAPMGTACTDT